MLLSGTKSACLQCLHEGKQQNRYYFVCKSCQTTIHKKCLGLRLSGICDIKNSKTETYWECQTWMSNKFPFALVGNKMIVQNNFNSSFSCK